MKTLPKNNTISIFLLLIISVCIFVSHINLFSKDTEKHANLTVIVEGIENDSGFIRVHLYNTERKENFPKKTINCYRRKVERISGGKCSVTFVNLPSDTYCLSVHHDENSNEEMDTNFLGLPKEGWGISNNVKLFMRLPKFDECSFKITSTDTVINVELRN